MKVSHWKVQSKAHQSRAAHLKQPQCSQHFFFFFLRVGRRALARRNVIICYQKLTGWQAKERYPPNKWSLSLWHCIGGVKRDRWWEERQLRATRRKQKKNGEIKKHSLNSRKDKASTLMGINPRQVRSAQGQKKLNTCKENMSDFIVGSEEH